MIKPAAILIGVLLAAGTVVALRLPDEATLSPAQMLDRESAAPIAGRIWGMPC